MTAPDAIIFDLDGTLTDTEVVWEKVRAGLAADDGVAYADQDTWAMMGMSTQEWSRYCVEKLGLRGTPDEVADRVVNGVADAYRSGRVQLNHGATHAVRRMAEHFPLAIASSSAPLLIECGVEALGISDVVSVRISSEQVGTGKPAPDVYLEACRVLGVDPANCVAVEDSTSGLRSAHAAGLAVVAVPPPTHGPSAEAVALADAVLENLDGLTVELVRSLFPR